MLPMLPIIAGACALYLVNRSRYENPREEWETRALPIGKRTILDHEGRKLSLLKLGPILEWHYNGKSCRIERVDEFKTKSGEIIDYLWLAKKNGEKVSQPEFSLKDNRPTWIWRYHPPSIDDGPEIIYQDTLSFSLSVDEVRCKIFLEQLNPNRSRW